MTQSRRRRAARRRWRILEALCLIGFAAIVGIMVQKGLSRRDVAQEEQSAALDAAALSQTPAAESTSEPIAEPAASSVPEVQDTLVELLAQNPDAVGVLTFDGDRSRYVCQGDDNAYYMTHKFDGTEDSAGMVYMDCRNRLWPRSDNLILYGHNMKDGTRFGTLARFKSVDYLLANPTFRFAGLYETADYTPFAIFVTTTDESDPAYFQFDQTDFEDEAAFDAYVSAVRERSLYFIPGDVQYGDDLLTLATCDSESEHDRLVIVLRKTSEISS